LKQLSAALLPIQIEIEERSLREGAIGDFHIIVAYPGNLPAKASQTAASDTFSFMK